MPKIDVQSLRALQASINTGINSLISASATEDAHAQSEAEEATHAAATGLARLTSSPPAEVYNMGLRPTVNTAVRIAIDLNLFEIIEHGETLQNLVAKTGAEETLLRRILRLLVAAQIFDEPKPNMYACTRLSKAITVPVLRDWLKMNFDSVQPIWQEAPSWIRANSFKDITDLTNNPCTTVFGVNFFDALAKNPQRQADFDSAMALSETLPRVRLPQYPYHDFVAEIPPTTSPSASKDDPVFIVDIGGGHGYYLRQVLADQPSLPGRKIVQDLAETISTLTPNPLFEAMACDFFTPQPIKHAKFYHLRHILHDWPDSACLQILAQIRPAMKPGFSKVLLNGFVLASSGVSAREAMIDLTMWINCGMERTKEQWRELLAKAGMKIVRVVMAEVGSVGIIEAVRDDEDDSSTTGAGSRRVGSRI